MIVQLLDDIIVSCWQENVFWYNKKFEQHYFLMKKGGVLKTAWYE